MPGTLPWRHVRAGELGCGSRQCGGPACLAGPRPPAVPPSSPGPRRKVLYQRAPRNIHRHVVLSEIKEAVAALPPVRSVLTTGSERQSHACSFRDLTGCRVVTWQLRAHGL